MKFELEVTCACCNKYTILKFENETQAEEFRKKCDEPMVSIKGWRIFNDNNFILCAKCAKTEGIKE